MHCYQAKQTDQSEFCEVYKLKMCNLSFYYVLCKRELLTLLELTKPQQRNPSLKTELPTQTLKADFDRLKIWQSRRPLYTAAIQRLTYQKLFEILQELADIEAHHQTRIWTRCVGKIG